MKESTHVFVPGRFHSKSIRKLRCGSERDCLVSLWNELYLQVCYRINQHKLITYKTYKHFQTLAGFQMLFGFRKLKTDLLDVKRKGAKRGSGRYSQRSCGRCLEPLSRLAVFSSQCKMCNHHVCRNCRTFFDEGTWLCSVCAKES